MIRLWLSREKGISIREQLSAQLVLGILSRRLAPGERLPSVRDLARRLKVHANTVSATYQDLAARGWVSQRKGAGVYVCSVSVSEPDGGIDGFARGWIEDGLARGFSMEALEESLVRVCRDLREQTATPTLLVVHPDLEFAQVIAEEIETAIARPVSWTGLDGAAAMLTANTCVLVTATSAAQILRELAPAVAFPLHHRVIGLKAMEEVIEGRPRPSSKALLAIVSRSESILQWSSTLLSVLGFAPDTVLLRSPATAGWKRGLSVCGMVAADIRAARELPKTIRPTVFTVVASDFLAELRDSVTAQKVS